MSLRTRRQSLVCTIYGLLAVGYGAYELYLAGAIILLVGGMHLAWVRTTERYW